MNRFSIESIPLPAITSSDVILEVAYFLDRNEAEKLQLTSIRFNAIIELRKNLLPLHIFDQISFSNWPNNDPHCGIQYNELKAEITSKNYNVSIVLQKHFGDINHSIDSEAAKKISSLKDCIFKGKTIYYYEEYEFDALRIIYETCGQRLNILSLKVSIKDHERYGRGVALDKMRVLNGKISHLTREANGQLVT